MKKLYTLCLSGFTFLNASAQYLETVGTPNAPTTISSYTGWDNQNILNYSGTAIVDTATPSNCSFSSGGGNLLFTPTAGTDFQISGLQDISGAVTVEVYFNMHGFNTANPNGANDLQLQISTDSGSTWNVASYTWAYTIFPSAPTPTPWDYFQCSYMLPYITNPITTPWSTPQYDSLHNVFIRFVQTGNTNTYRIDDIMISSIVLLDINLINFDASQHNDITTLNWTAVTSDNDIFYLERSIDGKNFTSINKQVAKGKGTFDYSYKDKEATATPISYYRLKLTEANGKTSYSKTLTISSNIDKTSALLQTVYPNPAKDVLFVDINSNSEQSIMLSIIDVNGKQVEKRNLPATQSGIYQIPLSKFPNGVYHIIADDGIKKETHEIIIQ